MASDPGEHILNPKPFHFSLRTLLILVTVVCVLLGLLVPALRSAREAAGRVQLSNRFKQLGLGLHMYNDAYGRFQTASVDSTGKPMNSWRFSLVPFLEQLPKFPPQSSIDYDPNLPWDDPTHAKLDTYFADFYCFFRITNAEDSTGTRILAITGPDTAFEDGKSYKLDEQPNDLIIIVETRNSGFHWMEPGDLDIRTMPRTINAPDGRGIAANIGNHFHVIFADGSVWLLSVDVPFEEVEKFLTIDCARRYDREEVLGEYAAGR